MREAIDSDTGQTSSFLKTIFNDGEKYSLHGMSWPSNKVLIRFFSDSFFKIIGKYEPFVSEVFLFHIGSSTEDFNNLVYS